MFGKPNPKLSECNRLKIGEKNPAFGKKHWVNESGVRRFQTESPGPEWQNGLKYKQTNEAQ
jgi:hypothetical protein